MKNRRLAIVGCVGVPGRYGGFETLAENLVSYHHEENLPCKLTVYCSARAYTDRPSRFLSANLEYVPLNANGVQSILYDIVSLASAVRDSNNVIILLGVSGAVFLPFLKGFSKVKVITNIDGIEWRRVKWKGFAKWFLHYSERVAVRFSDVIIADNQGIADYVSQAYGVSSTVIAYGGDQSVAPNATPVTDLGLPKDYAFSVCRIEPENNVDMIVDAFSRQDKLALVLVGNWEGSDYGRTIRSRYFGNPNLFLLDPIYDLGKLKSLRAEASVYVHGHSAGGTNPSLVEAMHFGIPILAFDCVFNRFTTANKALYFSNSEQLLEACSNISPERAGELGRCMKDLANKNYRWNEIAKRYFELVGPS